MLRHGTALIRCLEIVKYESFSELTEDDMPAKYCLFYAIYFRMSSPSAHTHHLGAHCLSGDVVARRLAKMYSVK